MSKFLIMLLAVMLITGCRSGGSSGAGSFLSSLFDSRSIVSGSSSGSGSSFVASGSSFVSGDSGFNAVANPEPATLTLIGIGLAGLAVAALRKKRK